ncbi:hypothetical protein HOLleu_25290 [Holothuria leucospilota]|uniref:Secreted protein n=1 Tax=Holothuria leucospilota TaxID=206669 RepID=A0A9Q1BSU2_HOLLE|nr:hypothetical protein HOLleu_25290 [Holothuria leucospilota]
MSTCRSVIKLFTYVFLSTLCYAVHHCQLCCYLVHVQFFRSLISYVLEVLTMADKNIYLTLSNGIKVPQIGLGTYKVRSIIIQCRCSMHTKIARVMTVCLAC